MLIQATTRQRRDGSRPVGKNRLIRVKDAVTNAWALQFSQSRIAPAITRVEITATTGDWNYRVQALPQRRSSEAR
jgi:hypothetical protein